jgi:hypothetical protein
MQGGAHKLTQSSHSLKPLSRDRSRRGQGRQEGPKRIHGPAFLLDSQERYGWERAGHLKQKLADAFGPAG